MSEGRVIRNFMPPGAMFAIVGAAAAAAARGEDSAAAAAGLAAAAPVKQWSSISRRTGERRSLHRIVRGAHCRHCNSAACLQYENCVNNDVNQRNWTTSSKPHHAAKTQQQSHPQLLDHTYSSRSSIAIIDDNLIEIDDYDYCETQHYLQQQQQKQQQHHTDAHTAKNCFSHWTETDVASEHDCAAAVARIDALRHGRVSEAIYEAASPGDQNGLAGGCGAL